MRLIFLTLLIMCLLVALALGCGRQRAPGNLQALAATSLSEQFESVLYSKPEFVSRWDTENPLPKGPADIYRYPFDYLWSALDSLPVPAAADLLANGDAVLLGARDFRSPVGLGGIRSRRCYVVVLKRESSFDLHKYAPEPIEAFTSGRKIWHWAPMLSEFGEGIPGSKNNNPQPSTLFATQIGQSYFLVSNDLNELETLAKRLTSSNMDSQDRRGVENWKELFQHEMWGYRKYSNLDNVDKMASGIQDVPTESDALLFFVDSRKKMAVVRLVLKERARESAVVMMYSRSKLPPPKPRGDRIWESDIPLSGDEESFEHSFGLICLFGFGIYS